MSSKQVVEEVLVVLVLVVVNGTLWFGVVAVVAGSVHRCSLLDGFSRFLLRFIVWGKETRGVRREVGESESESKVK